MGELVLVTGASGYIAAHIVQQLLEQGYKVRGTVRSLTNEHKLAPLRKLGGDKNENLELVEADLLNDECWPSIVDGCKYVLHTASPFPKENPKNEEEVIKPAVDGTLSVLRACAGKHVERVVVTSSCVAIGFGNATPVNGEKLTEEDWVDPKKASTVYEKSKILAEHAAWDYVKELPDGQKFELAVVNPGLVVGPPLTSTPGTSVDIIKQILNKDMPMLPPLHLCLVDVRDVAKAHIAAMNQSEAVGHRHVTVGETMWMKDVAEIIDHEFTPMGYNIPTSQAPYCMIWCMGRFDKQTKEMLPFLGKEVKYDNSRLVDVLGVNPLSMDDSLIETCHSLIEQGHVRKTQKYKTNAVAPVKSK